MDIKNMVLNKIHSSHPLYNLLIPISEEIEKGLSECRSKDFLVDYKLISEENRMGKLSHDLADEVPESASLEEKHILYQVYLLQQKNIYTLLSDLFESAGNILEIGCGVLDKRGDSFISGSFSREIRSKFTFCDINPSMIEKSKNNCPRASINTCDATKLMNEYSENTFDIVIGHNSLDTLSESDLETTLEQASHIIKERGYLVHIMSLPPFIYSTVHNLCKSNNIIIPIYLDTNLIFCSISKERYRNNLRDKAVNVDENMLIFLDYCASLDAFQMERLCNYLAQKGPLPFFENILCLGDNINPMNAYLNLLTSTLEKYNFSIDTSDFYSSFKEVNVQVSGPYEGNSLKYGPNGKAITSVNNVKWGKSNLEIVTHGLIANKHIL
ncbi:MAG: class I SAM-dependent methyltransferase [Chlamydiota bacterium]|nr:class I SAM-dependent methyltransferase [Chlamydiota bacterium]